MRKLRVGLNGVGRIGRTILRQWCKLHHPSFEIVAINNPGDFSIPVHLLNYDSVHGPISPAFFWDQDYISRITSESSLKARSYTFHHPSEIPWEQEGVELVIDATGKFKDLDSLSGHRRGSVKKVVLCAPGKNLDATIVVGVNENSYLPDRHHIISNASCTTNCLAPIIKILHEQWPIRRGLLTTVHAYTSDQNLLDGRHKDLRRARSAPLSIIPTSTGAARALGKVFPELEGRFDGIAFRVPTPNVSMVDMAIDFDTTFIPTREEINRQFHLASQADLKGILAATPLELVSIDFKGRTESSIIDLSLTNVVQGLAKVVAWYDNEAGFSQRVIDLVSFMHHRM